MLPRRQFRAALGAALRWQPSLPRAALAAPAGVAVGGAVVVLLSTLGGGPTPAAQVAPAANGPAPVVHPDAGSALRALVVTAPPRPRPTRASRSLHRPALDRPRHRWVRPFWGYLSSPYGWRWGRLHAGIDLAGPYGAPIVAATDGCITYAGPEAGYGEVMTIQDWDGTQTVYGHMSRFIRRSGCVKAGTVIALIGAAGDATGPHLHFEIRVDGTPINPIPFLARRGVRV